MIFIVRTALAALIITSPLSLTVGALAQTQQTEPNAGSGNGVEESIPLPGGKSSATAAPTPKRAFEFAKDLDGLFAQLKRTRDHKQAERISKKIWGEWQTSNSRSIDLLTYWARNATGRKQYDAALDLLDQVIVLRPEYAEGWNQRATLHYQRKDYAKSIADIEKVLALEPRHFGALSGLAVILEQLGRDQQALETWYRVLEVYPANRSAGSAIVRLEEDLAGSGI
ncbi:MAG: tetratricopeptide repeat protein [Pseudomonadota bacterium]